MALRMGVQSVLLLAELQQTGLGQLHHPNTRLPADLMYSS